MIDALGRVDDFRRGVMGRAEDFLAFLCRLAGVPGEAEITDFRAGLQIEQDVGGLDVAVDDAVLVGMGESVADCGDEMDDLGRIDGHAVGRMEQRLPGHVFHDDV